MRRRISELETKLSRQADEHAKAVEKLEGSLHRLQSQIESSRHEAVTLQAAFENEEGASRLNGQFRTWTLINRKQTVAKLIRVNADAKTIVLRRFQTGDDVVVPLGSLVSADREYVEINSRTDAEKPFLATVTRVSKSGNAIEARLDGGAKIQARIAFINLQRLSTDQRQQVRIFLSKNVVGQQVRVKPLAQRGSTARTAEFYVGDESVAELLVRRGLAPISLAGESTPLRLVQSTARHNQRGIWEWSKN